MDEHSHEPHEHVAENGILVKCYHHCKGAMSSVSFWIGMTLGFPVEHFLWEKVPPFMWISHQLGLM